MNRNAKATSVVSWVLAARVVSFLVAMFVVTSVWAYDKGWVKFVPKDPAAMTATKEQVSFTVSVLDGTNYKADTNVWARFKVVGKSGKDIEFDDVACQFPFLQIVVQNGSDQTLKLRGKGSNEEVVVAMDDDQGNTINALKKEKMREAYAASYRSFIKKSNLPDAALQSLIEQSDAMLQRLPFLSEDVTILPGRKAKFYTCFEYVPGAGSNREVNEWFKSRKEITIGFFDVPVQRDAAGTVQKKTSYQFPFKVSLEK